MPSSLYRDEGQNLRGTTRDSLKAQLMMQNILIDNGDQPARPTENSNGGSREKAWCCA